MMENILIIIILICILGGVVLYLYRSKKRGETCIGCPSCKKCAGKGACSHHKKESR